MRISKARERITLPLISRKYTSKDVSIIYTLTRIKHKFSLSKVKERRNLRSKTKRLKHSRSKLKRTFTFYDQDGDGKINTSNLGVIMQSLGGNPSKAQVDAIVTKEDLDGSIDFHKFVDLMRKYLRARPMDHVLHQAFETIDNDDDGYIDVAKLRHVLTTMGESLDQEEFDEWIRGVGVKSNGDVRYEDIIAPMVMV